MNKLIVPCLCLAFTWPSAGQPPAGRQPLPTLADFWAGRAAFRPDTTRQFGADFRMHFLSTARDGRFFWSYYVRPNAPERKDNRPVVGLAQSQDGIQFRDLGTVLGLGAPGAWDEQMVSFPGVWRDSATSWQLVYEGTGKPGSGWPGDIGLATSRDGKTWAKHPEPILRHAQLQPGDDRDLGLQWERNNIGSPALWKEGSMYYLFYHGFGQRNNSPDDCQVGVALGTDLRSLIRYRGNPVLRTGEAGAWDSGTIGRRSIRKEGRVYYMVYEGSTDQPYDKARWSSGLARSTDLLHWEKYPRPILPQTASGFGNDGPEWLETPDGRLHVYYRTGGNITRRATLAFLR